MSFGQKSGPTSNTNTNTLTNTSGTQNITSNPPDWYLNAWQSILGLGGDLYGGLATPVAGLTTDQQWASYLANGALQDYTLRPKVPAYDVFGMGSQWDKGPFPVATADLSGLTQRDAVAAKAAAEKAKAAQAAGAQLAPGEISPFMNPFIDTALDPALARLRQQQGEVQSRIGADAAASGMFGGSREAVSRMLADRNYRDTLANTAGNMLLQGWNTASGLAQNNANLRQQTSLTNAQLENAINQLNAQLGTDVSKFNAGMETDVSKLNAQLAAQLGIAGAQLGVTNAQMQNQAQQQYQNLLFQGAQGDAARFLQATQLQGALDAQDLQARLAGAESLNKYGIQEQQTAQAALNAYWQQLNNLARLLGLGDPGKVVQAITNSTTNQNQTGTTTTSKPVDIGSILLGSLLLGRKAASGGLL